MPHWENSDEMRPMPKKVEYMLHRENPDEEIVDKSGLPGMTHVPHRGSLAEEGLPRGIQRSGENQGAAASLQFDMHIRAWA